MWAHFGGTVTLIGIYGNLGVMTGRAMLNHRTHLTGAHLAFMGEEGVSRLNRARLYHPLAYAKVGQRADHAKQGHYTYRLEAGCGRIWGTPLQGLSFHWGAQEQGLVVGQTGKDCSICWCLCELG